MYRNTDQKALYITCNEFFVSFRLSEATSIALVILSDEESSTGTPENTRDRIFENLLKLNFTQQSTKRRKKF